MTNHTEIQLTPEHQAAIALHAEQEGKTWSELIEERSPVLPALNKQELQASLEMLRDSEADITAGRTRDLREALHDIASQHGITLEQ